MTEFCTELLETGKFQSKNGITVFIQALSEEVITYK